MLQLNEVVVSPFFLESSVKDLPRLFFFVFSDFCGKKKQHTQLKKKPTRIFMILRENCLGRWVNLLLICFSDRQEHSQTTAFLASSCTQVGPNILTPNC